MPNIATPPSDAELLAKLQGSYIDPAQKAKLAALLPKMTNAEKAELLRLITRSHEEYAKANKAYQENLVAKSHEYEQELKAEDSRFRKEFEGLERKDNERDLKVLEGEVTTINFTPKPAPKNGSVPRPHTFRNLLLALLFLGALAAAGLYALNA